MFSGLSAFPLTPLHDDALDERAYAAMVGRLASSGVDSITALGSTGAYAYLSLDERRRAARVAAEQAGDVPLIVGVGALRTSSVLRLAEDAANVGAAAVLVAPMSYLPLTDDDVLGLYADVASIGLPVIVYDNPGTTHFTFTDELYGRVTQLPSIVSIKIPGVPPDLASAERRIRDVRAVAPPHVTVGISGDSSAATGLIAGCDGWYSVIAGTIPGPALTIMRAMHRGDADAALAESARLQPLWNLFARHGGSLRVVAAIAELAGWAQQSCLPKPIRGLDAAARAEVAEVVERLDLLQSGE